MNNIDTYLLAYIALSMVAKDMPRLWAFARRRVDRRIRIMRSKKQRKTNA